jgi:hypothetical protein
MGPCVRRDDEIAAPPSSYFQTAPSTHASAPPATRSARVVRKSPPKEGVGNAGCSCTRSLACRKVTRELVTTDTPETPGIPARNGFNGFLRALPGDRAFLPPSSTDHSVNLTPASGRQDHTTSPSAGQRIRQSAAHVHRIPPRVRDDREPPLRWDETAGNIEVIWGIRKAEYFLRQDWTTQIRLNRRGKSAFWRRAFVLFR